MATDSVADLREAAALMRERAQAATPGRWRHLCMGSDGCSVINDGHCRDRRAVAWFGRKEWKADHADALYVASMPPAVALAVADWLDAEAEQAERPGALQLHGLSPGPLAIAWAYLGRDDA